MRTPIVLPLVLALSSAARGQVPVLDTRTALGLTGPRPVVMILGTHHMANNNLDAVKTNFDDPRSPKRQAELQVMLEHIKRFRPTKIAVEAPWGSTAIQERYQQYLAGKYELSANEIDQVALRLAKDLGRPTVFPIDYREGLDFDTPMKFATENGQADKVQAIQRGFAAIGKLFEQTGSSSLLDIYRLQNSRTMMSEGQKFYVYFAEIGKDSSYVGAEQLIRWYDRNARIAANILRTTTAPTDRVLVLIGSGHAYLLNEILSHSPSVQLEWAETYLK